MYTYKRAVGINRLMPRGEELLDISVIQTKDLFTQFDNLIIVIYDELAFQEVALDAQYYQNQLISFTGVIQDWLTANASVPLITSNTLPGTEYRYVTSHDIQYQWFSLKPGDASLGDDHQDLLTVHNADDIRVTKTDGSAVEYDKLVDRSLWTVNNHLVRAVEGTDCIYLLGAGKHFRINDNIHINSLNFNTVSKLKCYPITPEMIQLETHDTYRFLHITSPVSLVGKTVWASIGGRLYLNDVLQQRGENSMAVNTEMVDWFSRIFDSKDYIDLSSIIDKDRQVVPEDFFSTEDFFTKLLTDQSSFLIVLDNQHLYVETKPLVVYQYPFTYHTEETRPLPFLTGGGLFPKYWTRKIINRRLLDLDIGTQRKYVNESTGSYNEGHVFHGYTNRFKPSALHTGYLLYIRGLIQED
jgi:hypothetical protein